MRRFIDLFAGIGGFHQALSQRGMQCVFASEIDKAARSAYKDNFGLEPHGDLRDIAARSIPSHDILCAGFPCQPFSRSGNRKGFQDQRGRLFFEIVRIAKHHQPKVMLLENVKAILTLDNGRVRHKIYRALKKIGYRLDHVALNAGDFGIPQKRERVYFVALKADSPLRFTPPEPTHAPCSLRQILLPDRETAGMAVKRPDIVIQRQDEPAPANRPIRIGYLNKGGQGERIYSVNGHAITLSANGGGVGARTGLYRVNGHVRRLHIDEAKRAMGFDRQHVVGKGAAGYRQLGNAVIPPMVGRIYDCVSSAA